MPWDVIENVCRQVAVGVDQPNALTGFYILKDQIAEEVRFADAAFTDDVEMLAAVFGGQSKGPVIAPFDSRSDYKFMVRVQAGL